MNGHRLMPSVGRVAALEGDLDRAVRRARGPRLRKVALQPLRHLASRVLDLAAKTANTAIRCSVRTFWGRSLTVALPDPVSSFLFRYGFFEENVTRIMLRQLAPGHVVFDVGAHVGYFSALAADVVGRSGAVHAFEPAEQTRQILSRNLGALDQVRVVPSAVSERTGEMQLNDFGPAFASFNSLRDARVSAALCHGLQRRTYSVSAISIDDHVRDLGVEPDLVKIDAESAELLILRGMANTIAKSRPAIIVEVGDFDVAGAGSSTEIIEHLRSLGYRVWEMDVARRALVPHVSRNRYGYDNLLFVADH